MIRQPVRIFLKDSFHCLYRPERFRAFRRLRERANFPRRDFGPEQNWDAEMIFVTPSAGCLHCPADIVRASRLSPGLPHLPQTDPGGFSCGQLRECLGNLPESTRTEPKTLGANDDPTCLQLIGKLSGIVRITRKPCGSNAEEVMRKTRNHADASRMSRGRILESAESVIDQNAKPCGHM